MEVLGSILPDGTLVLDEPLHAAPGRVKITLEPLEPNNRPEESLVEFVSRSRHEMEAAGSQFMNDEEVSRWVDELRCDDDRIAEAYRQTNESKRS